MSVNLFVKIELPGGKTLESDYCYEYPDEVSQADFMHACIENYNEEHDSDPCPELKVSGYEILVNGNVLRARVLKASLFQNSEVDPELQVKLITLRPRRTGETNPPPGILPVINAPIPKSGDASPQPGQMNAQEVLILQHILTQAKTAQRVVKPITETAQGIYDEKDIRKRATELEKMLGELSTMEPIFSACAGNLVGDLEEVRKYAKNITMPPIGAKEKDDPTLPYYQHLIGLPFPMDNLERLIANHNRLTNSNVYKSMLPTDLEVLKYLQDTAQVQKAAKKENDKTKMRTKYGIELDFEKFAWRSMTESEFKNYVKIGGLYYY